MACTRGPRSFLLKTACSLCQKYLLNAFSTSNFSQEVGLTSPRSREKRSNNPEPQSLLDQIARLASHLQIIYSDPARDPHRFSSKSEPNELPQTDSKKKLPSKQVLYRRKQLRRMQCSRRGSFRIIFLYRCSFCSIMSCGYCLGLNSQHHSSLHY